MRIIPLLGSILSLTGIAVLTWYFSKTIAERQIVDDKANRLAQQWYHNNLDVLNVQQVQRIYDEVRKIG